MSPLISENIVRRPAVRLEKELSTDLYQSKTGRKDPGFNFNHTKNSHLQEQKILYAISSIMLILPLGWWLRKRYKKTIIQKKRSDVLPFKKIVKEEDKQDSIKKAS